MSDTQRYSLNSNYTQECLILFKLNLKFGDGDGPNLCRVKK